MINESEYLPYAIKVSKIIAKKVLIFDRALIEQDDLISAGIEEFLKRFNNIDNKLNPKAYISKIIWGGIFNEINYLIYQTNTKRAIKNKIKFIRNNNLPIPYKFNFDDLYLQKLIDKLKYPSNEIIFMYFWGGLTHKEISVKLNQSISNIRYLKLLALKKLKGIIL